MVLWRPKIYFFLPYDVTVTRVYISLCFSLFFFQTSVILPLWNIRPTIQVTAPLRLTCTPSPGHWWARTPTVNTQHCRVALYLSRTNPDFAPVPPWIRQVWNFTSRCHQLESSPSSRFRCSWRLPAEVPWTFERSVRIKWECWKCFSWKWKMNEKKGRQR